MDEKDLLIFLTLADTGNLTRTAEKLYLSQPTLSHRLLQIPSTAGSGGLHGSVPGRHPQSLHQPQP